MNSRGICCTNYAALCSRQLQTQAAACWLAFGWVYLLLALRCLALDLQGLFSIALGLPVVSSTGETCWGFELSRVSTRKGALERNGFYD